MILTADSIVRDIVNYLMMFSVSRNASSKKNVRRMRNDVQHTSNMCIVPHYYLFSKSKRMIHMSKKRFKITDGANGCFIIDSKGELAALPLKFSYSDLSDGNKKKLQKWMTILNKKG